ncbi:uncharacterized protein LOC128198025 [Bicyclus anynana]|uniref:Uncharacterized protein LOC128198025 n=1 Tax=Bicyclus anynana TaxID=110368 RepID=A0ABM3M5E6_BICAN|nr:uncharacterized protein LOC128198025 [Bicyclus anynana]
MTVNNQNNVKNQNIVDEEGETSNQPLLTTPENDHQEASTSENHAPAPSAPPYYLTESVANNAVANQHANRFMQFLEMAPNVTHFYSALVPILDGFYMPVQPAEELDSLIPILDGFHMPVQPAEELDCK